LTWTKPCTASKAQKTTTNKMQDTDSNMPDKLLWIKKLGLVLAFFLFYSAFVIYSSKFAEILLLKILDLPETKYLELVKNDARYMLLNYIPNFLFSVLAVFLFWKIILKKSYFQIGFIDSNWLKNSSLGAALGILAIGGGFFILKALNLLHVADIQVCSSDLFIYFLMFLAVSVSEELLTRGLMLHTLMEGMNKYVALTLVSIIFGALHLFNDNISFLSFFNITLAGWFLGLSYIYNKSLYFPIGLHLTWNYFQGPIFGFEVSGNVTHSVVNQVLTGSALLTGGAFGFEGSVLAIPIMLVGIVLIYLYFGKEKKDINGTILRT
jgi:uncharacterized protein